ATARTGAGTPRPAAVPRSERPRRRPRGRRRATAGTQGPARSPRRGPAPSRRAPRAPARPCGRSRARGGRPEWVRTSLHLVLSHVPVGAGAPLPAALDHRVVLEPVLRDAADGGGGAVLRQALGELAALLDALGVQEARHAAGGGRRRVLRHVHPRAVVDAVAGQPVASLLPGSDLP